SYRMSDARLSEMILGRAVDHQFEMEDGSKDGWRGLVLARAPMMPTWFFITYEKDPVLYLYQLLEDYKEGDLRILPDSDEPAKPSEPGEVVESLVGKQVEYVKEDGTQRTGTVIHQVEAKPCQSRSRTSLVELHAIMLKRWSPAVTVRRGLIFMLTFGFVSLVYFLTCRPHTNQKYRAFKGPVDDTKYQTLLQEHEEQYHHYVTSLTKQIFQLKKALQERRRKLQKSLEQAAVMLPVEVEELGQKSNSELEVFFNRQLHSAEIYLGTKLPNEHALVPFESFTLHRVYQLETGLARQPVQRALRKDLGGALEAALHILNDPQKRNNSQHRRIYSPRDFFEGIFRTERDKGTMYDLTFRDNTSLDFRRLEFFRPFAPLMKVKEEVIDTSNMLINIIVPLTKRVDAFRQFMLNFREVCIRQNERVHLTVVYFGTDKMDEVRGIIDATARKMRYRNFTLVHLNETFSRGRGLDVGAQAWKKGNVLLFFCDLDVHFTSEFLYSCRMNAQPGKRVFYPIPFNQYNPEVIYGEHNIPPAEKQLVISKSTGFWQDLDFGMTCQYRSDFINIVEFMVVRCRPFYLPREFTAVLIISVYIPPGATAKDALCELYSAISGLQNTHPDGLFIVAGDFNHANLKSVLPKFHQHVNFATRGANALDLVYTNIPSAYRAEPRPHLGYSDHISVMLIPAYRPLVRRSKPVLKQVRTWPSGAISALQDCFEYTDWQMFREAATYSTTTDLEEYTSSVTSYIGKCIDDVTVSKTITTRPNQKPWMTAEVRALLKARDSAFKAGDKAALRKARAKLSRGIREAKRAHGQSIHSHFRDSGDTRRMWQGIQAITNYRTAPPACDSDASLPDALNHFYARFETQNSVAARKTTPPPDDQVLCLTAADVRKTLRRVNPRKAAGPDNIPARVLRECADQLTDVFTDIFNISLSSATVPTCLKATTIIPVPKKSSVSCLNDYRPIALTPIIMKCFERLVLRHIKTLLPPSLDPLQFAYRPNRSTDDAISTTLHLALTHLDNRDTYVRMLFIDFSSAFNTIIPQHLIGKLNLLGLNTSLSNWILDFLTGRPQSVRIGPMHSSNHIIKFADDTTVVGLISKNDESAYREEVQRLTDWCRTNNLSLNVDKTKEMVVDFRRTRRDHSPLHIDGSTVEIVKSTKFLGVHLAEDLTWSLNTSTITKKAQQRLYFLRRLRKAHLPPPILTTFYRGTIESILSSCITAWFGNCTASDRKSLQRVVRTAEKIIGVSLPTITDIYTTRCIRKTTSIVDDYTHPSHTLFTLLPSGKSNHKTKRRVQHVFTSYIISLIPIFHPFPKGGFESSMKTWGKEDLHLYRKYLHSNLMVVRAPSRGLFHMWHETLCADDLPTEAFQTCMRSRAMSEASHSQMGELLFRQEIDTHLRKHTSQ
ncbi:hypothetical protein NFI96_030543, partial [Prochilodus magdalenae]